MAENSESNPPIPMSSNLKLGWRIALGGALSNNNEKHTTTRLALALPLSQPSIPSSSPPSFVAHSLLPTSLNLDLRVPILHDTNVRLSCEDSKGSGRTSLAREVDDREGFDDGFEVATFVVEDDGFVDGEGKAGVELVVEKRRIRQEGGRFRGSLK